MLRPATVFMVMGIALSSMVGLASAQVPVGVPTSIGGVTPSLHSQPVWFGNDSFAYELRGAPPGGSALLALSLRRDQLVSGGITIGLGLDPTSLVSLTPFNIDVQGRGQLDRPILGPGDPSLAGVLLFAQAAVADPVTGLLGATQALQLEVSLRPIMFLASDTSTPRLADPYSAQITLLPRNFVGSPTAARFINGGRDLILLTTSGVWHLDSLAPALGFTQWASGNLRGLEWDPVGKRVVCYEAGLLFIFNGDRSSSGFGQGQLPRIWPAPMNLSADGSMGFMKNGANVEVIDFAPTSPTYLQVIQSSPVPLVIGQPNFEWTALSPDGRIGTYGYVSLIGSVREEHRLDLSTGQWIDHNPQLPGTQGLGVSSQPVIGISDALFWLRDDSRGYIINGFSSPRRIERSLDNFATHVTSPTSVSQLQASWPYAPRRLGLSSSGRFLVEQLATIPGLQGTSEFFLTHLDSGIRVPWFQFADDGAYMTSAWR